MFDASQAPGEPVLRVDFVLPEADTVSAIEASVAGKPLEPAKVKFSQAQTLPGQRCAVLFLVDNTPDMGDYLPQIRQLLQRVADQVGSAPFQLGLATFSDDVRVLVPIGGPVADFKSPDKLRQIDGSGPSTEIYLCAQHAIPILAQSGAMRKFLVIISNGRGEDKKYTHDETVAAARAAQVRICTVGYAQPQGDSPSYLQTLTKLSEDTGGYKERANVMTRELPAGFESNFKKYAVSGGRAEVSLAGLAAPVALEFKITTEAKREYNFIHKVDGIAAATEPAKTPEKPPEKAPDAPPDKMPDKKPDGSGTPPKEPETDPGKKPNEPDKPDANAGKDSPVQVPTGKIDGGGASPRRNFFEKTWAEVRRQIKERPNMAAMAGGGGLIVLVLLIVLLSRSKKAPAKEEEPQVVAPQFVAEEPSRTPPQEEAPALAWLESLDGQQSRLPIRKSAVRLGRKEDNDIAFRNDSVSAHHAEIVQRGTEFIITNLAASNGVWLNGKRVESSPLAHNDVIELGEVRLRFLHPDASTPHP